MLFTSRESTTCPFNFHLIAAIKAVFIVKMAGTAPVMDSSIRTAVTAPIWKSRWCSL